MFERVLPAFLVCIAAAAQAAPQDELRDPTRPTGWRLSGHDSGVPSVTSETPFRLQGLVSRGGERAALINGRRVSVGDLIENALVMKIENNRVVLDRGGEAIELVVGVSAVKSPSPKREEQ